MKTSTYMMLIVLPAMLATSAEAAPRVISSGPERIDVKQDSQYDMGFIGSIPALVSMKIYYEISHHGTLLRYRSVPTYNVSPFGSTGYITLFGTDIQMACNQVQTATATPLKPKIYNKTLHHRMPYAPDYEISNIITCP